MTRRGGKPKESPKEPWFKTTNGLVLISLVSSDCDAYAYDNLPEWTALS